MTLPEYVPCGCTPPCDVSEPHAGWEAWITNIVTAALLGNRSDLQINSREETETGRALTDRFTGHLGVRQYLCEPYLSERQVKVIVLMLGCHMPGSKVAIRLEVDPSTVSRDRHDALEALCRLMTGNPLLKMPGPVYVRDEKRAKVGGIIRRLGL